MVKKNSKCGLNTGNTLRGSRRQAAIREYQKYGCLVLRCDEPCANNFTAKEILDDVHSYLPSHNHTVEYSLNKKCRWALPAQMKQKVKEAHDSRDLEITIMEHTLSLPKAGHHIAGFKTCDSYYSNNGPVKERLSKTEMNIPSAKRGRSAQDHLTKRERRALRKAEREGTTQSTEFATYDLPPKCELHIAYSASSDGNLFKDLITTAVAKPAKDRNEVSGCSKRFLRQLDLDDCMEFDEVDGAESEDHIDYLREPLVLPLSDFAQCHNRNRDTDNSDSSNSLPDRKDHKVYLDTQPPSNLPEKPPQVAHAIPKTQVTPVSGRRFYGLHASPAASTIGCGRPPKGLSTQMRYIGYKISGRIPLK